MAGHNISGNVGTNGSVGEIVYLVSMGDYPEPQPVSTVTDANKNYTFANIPDGVYQLYTAKAPLAQSQVILAGADAVDVNFSS